MSMFRPHKDSGQAGASPPPRLSRLRHQSPTPQIRVVGGSPKHATADRAPRACRSADMLGKLVETNKRKAAKGKSPKREEEKKKHKKAADDKKLQTEASAPQYPERKSNLIRKKKKNLKEYLLKPTGSHDAHPCVRRKSPHRADAVAQLTDVKKRELLFGLLQTMDSVQVQELIEWNQRRHLQREQLLHEARLHTQEAVPKQTKPVTRLKKGFSQANPMSELPPSLKLRIGEIVNGRKKSEANMASISQKGSRVMLRKLSKPTILKPLSHSKSAVSDMKRKANKSSIKSPGPGKKRKGLLHKKPNADKKTNYTTDAFDEDLKKKQRQKSNESNYSRDAEKELNNLSEVQKRRFSSSSLEGESEEKKEPKSKRKPVSPRDVHLIPLHVEPQDLLTSNYLPEPAKKNHSSHSNHSAASESEVRDDPPNPPLPNSKSPSKTKSDKTFSGSRLVKGTSEKKRDPQKLDARDADSMVMIERSDQERESSKKVDECIQVEPEMLEALRPSAALEASAEKQDALKDMQQPAKSDRVEKLAKEEYAKWSHVKSMLHQIEDKIGAKAASEVRDLFSKLEMFASQSKKNLKEGFLAGAGDMCLSNQLSEIRTRRSDDVLASQLRDLKSPGHSQQGPIAASQDGVVDSREDTPAVACSHPAEGPAALPVQNGQEERHGSLARNQPQVRQRQSGQPKPQVHHVVFS